MKSTILKLNFPLWQYLNQQVFKPNSPVVLNPYRFWVLHRLHHLERCWLIYYEPEKGSRNT